jgi:gp16 family phage-associated protein
MPTNALQARPFRTEQDVRSEFRRLGLSISDWARSRDYSVQLVYQVLAGRKRCLRGQSHAIAVSLGLKAGAIGSMSDLEKTLTLPHCAAKEMGITESHT